MSTGLKGSLRAIAMLAALLAAALALGALFGWLPAEQLQTLALQGFGTLAVIAVLALVLGGLLGRRDGSGGAG